MIGLFWLRATPSLGDYVIELRANVLMLVLRWVIFCFSELMINSNSLHISSQWIILLSIFRRHQIEGLSVVSRSCIHVASGIIYFQFVLNVDIIYCHLFQYFHWSLVELCAIFQGLDHVYDNLAISI